MVHTTGAQLGLLAFAVAVIAGIAAGNSATVILTRAIISLMAGAVIGQFAGWGAKVVLREYLQRRKLKIDREHLDAVNAMNGAIEAATAEAEGDVPEATPIAEVEPTELG